MPTKRSTIPKTDKPDAPKVSEPPAMGERRARWGYGYQDKVVTEQVLDFLRADVRDGTSHLEGVRLADLEAGRADDFVLVFDTAVQGNSIKWSGDSTPMNWADLIGADGLLHELAEGSKHLRENHSGKDVTVQLQTNRSASTANHPAQLISTFSVADFFRQHWPNGPTANDSSALNAAWSRIASAVGLANQEFKTFVKACRVRFAYLQPPHAGQGSQDERIYLKQFQDLHKAFATWLTDNPQGEFIDRPFLLDAIGFRSFRSGLVQQFPSPEIPYERNVESAIQVEQAISAISGGYLAVTGSAGIGKSTLVQDVLSEYPFFIPYYAYLPDGIGNPRDRGEALTFFQDVINRLDRLFEGRRSLGVADLPQGREALRDHMRRANALFQQDGHKTILLIDGLDHVQREPGLENPLLFQLPLPDEVPDGFVIILSSQPQALLADAIERHVSATLSTSPERCIEIEGLSRDEVHTITKESEQNLTFEDGDALFLACQRNPLILTYLLKHMAANPGGSVAEAIAAIGSYSGDMDLYYRSALAIPLRQQDTREVFALISRAVSPIPIAWITRWPERAAFESIYQTTLAPFVRVEADNLYFIHNSLIAFLKTETRSVLPGADLDADERAHHQRLAERCGNALCSDPVGRSKVFHLLRAERFRELLDLLTLPWLKEGVEAFVPHADIRPILLHGMAAAWKLMDYGHVVRLMFLDFEFSERTSRLETGSLARELLSLGKPRLAASQIRSNGRVLIEEKHALSSSADLLRYAIDHDDSEVEKVATTVYLQSKPINFIYRAEPISRQESHTAIEALQTWADIAPLFETPKKVFDQVQRLRFTEPSGDWEEREETVKAALLYRATVTSLDDGATVTDCVPLVAGLARLKIRPLYFAALISLCSHHPSTQLLRKLEKHHLRFEPNSDLNLKFAELLFNAGRLDRASTICTGLKHVRIDSYRNRYAFGLSDISYTIRLSRLKHLLGIDVGEIPAVTDEDSEALGRIEGVARDIGVLIAKARLKELPPNLEEVFRSLLLFHNRPINFSHYSVNSNYRVVQSKLSLYSRIAEVAVMFGVDGVDALGKAFLDLVESPAGDQFNSVHRRFFALCLFQNRVLSFERASKLGLSDARDVNADDPAERQQACFDIAVFLLNLGNEDGAEVWLHRAGTATAGAGNHKDYHMTQLADWLLLACGSTIDELKVALLEKFVRALEVAGGAGATRAISKILRHLAGSDPDRASKLAIELIDREMLSVRDALGALLSGESAAGVSVYLAAAVFCELFTLLDTSDYADVVLRVLRLFPVAERVDGARRLVDSIRTNALPRNRREFAKAIERALVEDALGTVSFTDGLPAEREDSSSEWSYYRLSDGERLSRRQVALRLSNPEGQDLWNPNPSENERFSWWDAIREAKPRDLVHAERLLSTFTTPDYKDVEILLWKSRIASDEGDRSTAKLFADQALEASKGSSWFRQLDGAKLRMVYSALIQFNVPDVLKKAREHFGRDLAGGKLWGTLLLDDAPEIFGFLGLEWPSDTVLKMIEDHVDNVLSVSRSVGPIHALCGDSEIITVNSGICRFVIYLLAFPVVDIGVAARRALGRYASDDEAGCTLLLEQASKADVVQFEHLLSAIQIASKLEQPGLSSIQSQIQSLNEHESAAIRAIARRICVAQNWTWDEIRNRSKPKTIVLPTNFRYSSSPRGLIGSSQESQVIVELASRVIETLESSSNDQQELQSELLQIYWKIEKNYLWSDESRLKNWMESVGASFWLNPRAVIGREAGMRLLGARALRGLAPASTEQAYDLVYPAYDPTLELYSPVERPGEMRSMAWEFTDGNQKRWLAGEDADGWTYYPSKIGNLHILGERTMFIRPDWEWPREERFRGILSNNGAADEERDSLASLRELTYDSYLSGRGQHDEQIIVWNDERQLIGASYRWIALNAKIARLLGWNSSDSKPFEWEDASGTMMVKSIFWRDGWIGLKPPHLEPLGEGWLVVATDAAVEAIGQLAPQAYQHLWVERHSNGRNTYHGSWHLVSTMGDRFSS